MPDASLASRGMPIEVTLENPSLVGERPDSSPMKAKGSCLQVVRTRCFHLRLHGALNQTLEVSGWDHGELRANLDIQIHHAISSVIIVDAFSVPGASVVYFQW